MKSSAWKTFVWTLRILPLLALAAFLHFYLPGKDVVRIVDTDVKRMDVVSKNFVKEDTTGQFTRTRDVRFINTAWPDGTPRVYRNEETDWGFPWYFKFDSGNLQTLAQDLRSTKQEPAWVVVTHYGWRIELFSMFPNAVEIDPAAGPDVFPIPWFNIGFFVLLGLLAIYLWRVYLRFVANTWLPFMERLDLDERFDNAGNGFAQVWRWLTANLRDRRRS
jgi:hypothetical protein